MYLVLFLIILIGATALSSLFNKKIGFSILLDLFLIIFLMYVLGIFLPLNVSFYIVIIISIIGFIYAFYKKKIDKKRIFNFPLYVFTFLFIILSLINIGKGLHNVDEYTHWGDIVYAMFYGNRLSAFNTLDGWYNSYPPAISLFQYFFVKVLGYSEGVLYFSYQLFGLSLVLPFLDKIKGRTEQFILIVLICLFFPVTLFDDFYNSIYVDAMLGLMFGFIIAYGTIYKELDKADVLMIGLGLFILTLHKDAGLFLSIMAFIYLCLIMNKDNKRRYFMNICIFLLFILGAKISWASILYFCKTPIRHASTFSFSSFYGVLTGNSSSDKLNIKNDFFYNFFTTQVLSEPLKLTYIALLMILVLLIFFMYKKDEKDKWALGFLCVGALLYMFGLLICFLYNFSSTDDPGLSSYDRYSVIYLNGLLMFIILSLIYKYHSKESLFVILVIIILFNSVSIKDVFVSSYSDKENNYYRSVISEIDKDSKIVVFSYNYQRDRYARYHYLTRPIKLTGDCDKSCITSDEKVLKNKNYDYLYVDAGNDIKVDGKKLKNKTFYRLKSNKLIEMKR